MPRALISGVTGQDGRSLAEALLAHGCELHGFVRRSSTFTSDGIERTYDGDLRERERLA